MVRRAGADSAPGRVVAVTTPARLGMLQLPKNGLLEDVRRVPTAPPVVVRYTGGLLKHPLPPQYQEAAENPASLMML